MFLCSSVLCGFGDDFSRVSDVRKYFAPTKGVSDSFVQYYVRCLMKDEPKNRLMRKQHERIYLDMDAMVSINLQICSLAICIDCVGSYATFL